MRSRTARNTTRPHKPPLPAYDKTPAESRCPWPGISDPEYARYHDEEWGVPQTNSRALFEKLTLEGFQAGLSWLTILKKRDAFRDAFAGFDPERIVAFSDTDVERLMGNPGIVRNRAKIEAAIGNARAYLALERDAGFAAFLWGHLPDGPIINAPTRLEDVPTRTELSNALSKSLNARGFRFVGPTTLYAFMQSVGMVNDHLITCPRQRPCADKQKTVRLPEG